MTKENKTKKAKLSDPKSTALQTSRAGPIDPHDPRMLIRRPDHLTAVRTEIAAVIQGTVISRFLRGRNHISLVIFATYVGHGD